MANCDDDWDSTRDDKDDGTVTIKNGKGHHKQKNKAVKVGCFDDGMTWDMDDGSTHLHYEGTFNDDGTKVKGTCRTTTVGESARDNAVRDDEVWVGTKVTL